MAILSVNRFNPVYHRIYFSEIQHRNYTIQNVTHNPLLHILISTFKLQASLVIFEVNYLEFLVFAVMFFSSSRWILLSQNF